MQIVRVETDDGQVAFGQRAGERVLAIEGELFGEFRLTDRPLAVRRLLAPLEPSFVFAIGLNYRDHAAESGKAIPDAPVVFAKALTSVIGPGEPIRLPAVAQYVDYEAELAVVIGRTARNVPAERALEHVLGYTCANDVSERYWQQRLGQWVRAKSFDTFCPLGPWIETDLADPQTLRVRTILNGQVMQDSSTAEMIFPVAELIAFLSADLTLRPGTVILTGTPPGVGVARKPPVKLTAGDEVTIAIDGLGELTNPVRSA